MLKKLSYKEKRKLIKYVRKTYSHGNKKFKLSPEKTEQKRIAKNKRRNLKKKLLSRGEKT